MTIGEAEVAVGRLEKDGILHAANLPVPGDSLTTDKAVADERETIALMQRGRGRGAAPMRGRAVDKALRNGPLTAGQKEAVKLIRGHLTTSPRRWPTDRQPNPRGRVTRFDATDRRPVDKWTAAPRPTTSPQGQKPQQKRSTHMVHKPVNSECSRQSSLYGPHASTNLKPALTIGRSARRVP